MENPLDREEARALRRKARIALLDALQTLGGSAARSDLLLRAERDGGFSERELAAPPPDKGAATYERAIDHALSWELTNLKRDGLVANPQRGTWRLAGAAAAPEQPVAAGVAPTRLEELRAMPYRRYLQTPEWRKTRAAALLRAEHCCALDVTHTERLEVHHRTYARIGEERGCDLMVLCHECHERHHAANGRPGPRPERPPESFPPPFVATTTPAAPAAPVPPVRKPSLMRRLLSRD
jgi:hypothetical protein